MSARFHPTPAGDDDPAPVPDRYALREDDEGRRYLSCREAPTVRVFVEEGAVNPSAARGAPAGTIFLDGAAQGPPFLDREREVHNLDHHEGCVRSFTLAACEQALVLVLKGFDLRAREWTVRANEPDLDTVLALWVLLNHMRLASSPALRRRAIPLIRLEGLIDAHGLELQELSGFPEDLHRRTLAKLDSLHELELSLARKGPGEPPDRLERTASMLRALDARLYSAEDFDREQAEVEELAREKLPDGSLVIACRSAESIYRAEQTLRWLYGDRLGLIVLFKESEGDTPTVTLRQVDSFLPNTLEAAYAELNLLDPAAGPRGSSRRWGGSAEIGGSPRAAGTLLGPREIVRACARAFRGPTLGERVTALGRGLGAAVAALGAAWATRRLFPGAPIATVATLLVTALAGLGLVRAHRRPGLYGFRRPSGQSWWLLLPGALLGALAGGAAVLDALASVPAPFLESFATGAATRGSPWSLLLAALLLPSAAELLFRGLVQGELSRAFRRRREPGSWMPGPAAALSAALYAATPVALAPLLWRLPAATAETSVGSGAAGALACLGALVLGLACGVARDRAESVVPPVVIHLLAAAAWIVVVSVV